MIYKVRITHFREFMRKTANNLIQMWKMTSWIAKRSHLSFTSSIVLSLKDFEEINQSVIIHHVKAVVFFKRFFSLKSEINIRDIAEIIYLKQIVKNSIIKFKRIQTILENLKKNSVLKRNDISNKFLLSMKKSLINALT